MTESKKPNDPQIRNCGLWATHSQPCAVLHKEEKFAVIDCANEVFHPGHEARELGWRLVQAKTRWQRFLLDRFFPGPDNF